MAGTVITPDQPTGPGPAAPVKRTRRTDAWTTLFFVITAVFGAWAVGLIVLTTFAIAQPSFLYSDWKVGLKAGGATVVALLALSQAYTMGAAMGTFPKAGIKMKYLMRSHRYLGRIALVLAAVIAFFCMTDIGAPQSPLTSLLHGIFGSTAFVAIAVKLGLLKWRPALAYDAAPWLGRYAVFAFIVVWVTSVLTYYTDIL
jgi:Family of unknown function (DUF6529)